MVKNDKTDKKLESLLYFLSTTGRKLLLKRFNKDRCIATTAIAIKFLSKFGYQGEPIAVCVVIANSPAVEWMKVHAGKIPTAQEQDTIGGWLMKTGFTGVKKEKFWDGHLVFFVGDYFVNLTIDQNTRSHKQIILEPFVANISPEIKAQFINNAGPFVLILNGCLLEYRAFPNDQSFRDVQEWNAKEAIDQLADMLAFRYERR